MPARPAAAPCTPVFLLRCCTLAQPCLPLGCAACRPDDGGIGGGAQGVLHRGGDVCAAGAACARHAGVAEGRAALTLLLLLPLLRHAYLESECFGCGHAGRVVRHRTSACLAGWLPACCPERAPPTGWAACIPTLSHRAIPCCAALCYRRTLRWRWPR